MSEQPDIFDLLAEEPETRRRLPLPICDTCGQYHHSRFSYARHRFGPPEGVRYAAPTMPDAPERMTRTEAVADECAHLAALRGAS